MAGVPHIKFPPRLAGTRLKTFDQDSPEEVQACVINLLLTPPGLSDEEDLRGMGLANQAFRRGGPDLVEIERQIQKYERRTETILLTERPELLDEAMRRINVRLATQTGE